MIGKLTGRLDAVMTDSLLLDTGSVGYLVHVGAQARVGLPPLGNVISLYTNLLIREDDWQLYGFLSLFECAWHRNLMGVQGVGAKSAMAILDSLGCDGIARAIMMEDLARLRRVPGIGPKTAQRLLIDLKDKIPGMVAQAENAGPSQPIVMPVMAAAITSFTAVPVTGGSRADALAALQGLGYAPADALRAIMRVESPDASVQMMIKGALKLLSEQA